MLDSRVFSRRLHIVGYILQMYVDMPGPASPGAFSLKTIIRGLNLKTLIFVILLLCLLSGIGRAAGPTVGDYLKTKSYPQADIFLLGLAERYTWANSALEKNNRTPLFCTPYGLDLREANFKRIVDNKIEEYVIEKKTFKKTDRVIGLLLLLGLQEMFPCDGTAEYRK